MTITQTAHQLLRVENEWPACRCGYEPVGVPKLDALDLVAKHVLSYRGPAVASVERSPLQRLTEASAAFLAAGRELEAAQIDFARVMGSVAS